MQHQQVNIRLWMAHYLKHLDDGWVLSNQHSLVSGTLVQSTELVFG